MHYQSAVIACDSIHSRCFDRPISDWLTIYVNCLTKGSIIIFKDELDCYL